VNKEGGVYEKKREGILTREGKETVSREGEGTGELGRGRGEKKDPATKKGMVVRRKGALRDASTIQGEGHEKEKLESKLSLQGVLRKKCDHSKKVGGGGF